ncbi:MAG: hypothetical protein K2I64_03745 [Muribaculaceae bacterium]|nr:hypothetical protein [Muribaculaceae bacterium]
MSLRSMYHGYLYYMAFSHTNPSDHAGNGPVETIGYLSYMAFSHTNPADHRGRPITISRLRRSFLCGISLIPRRKHAWG